MKTHYTEADLLETYYTQPGESMPVMMHLANCSECAAKYEKLERKLRDLGSCDTLDRPDTFWTRQRHLIMRGIAAQKHETRHVVRTLRVAAAAAFAFFMGGAVMYEAMKPAPQPELLKPIHRAHIVAPASDDPWDSAQLKSLHSVVQWEAWVESANEDEL